MGLDLPARPYQTNFIFSIFPPFFLSSFASFTGVLPGGDIATNLTQSECEANVACSHNCGYTCAGRDDLTQGIFWSHLSIFCII